MIRAYLDLETSGLSTETDDILSAGVILDQDGVISLEFESFHGVPAGIENGNAFRHNGLTHEQVHGLPRFFRADGLLLMSVLNLAHEVIGWNIQFDDRFLQKRGIVIRRTLDLMHQARDRWPGLSSYRLNDIARYFGFNEQTHTALSDARLLRQVHLAMKAGARPQQQDVRLRP